MLHDSSLFVPAFPAESIFWDWTRQPKTRDYLNRTEPFPSGIVACAELEGVSPSQYMNDLWCSKSGEQRQAEFLDTSPVLSGNTVRQLLPGAREAVDKFVVKADSGAIYVRFETETGHEFVPIDDVTSYVPVEKPPSVVSRVGYIAKVLFAALAYITILAVCFAPTIMHKMFASRKPESDDENTLPDSA